MQRVSIILGLIIVTSWLGCRKDQYPELPLPNPYMEDPLPPCIGDYNLYSNDTFSFVKKHLVSPAPTGPFDEYPAEYIYGLNGGPVFNPKNPYEIVYPRKKGSEMGTIEREIWKFSFCTGEATLITTDLYYNLDWGSNGWIIYTGTGHAIYKVKDNGDSLTQLSTEGGFNRAGKWNPSGTLYWNLRDDGNYIKKSDGSTLKYINTLPFKAIDWINDTTILGWRDYNFYAMTIHNENLTLLNSNWVSHITTYLYDNKNQTCYVPIYNGLGHTHYFLKYDLSGSNQVDTISYLYDSYRYSLGDVANNKIVTTLKRTDWKDSVNNDRYVRYDILLMDLDGTHERIINFPE